jgi:hypothetical protein
MENTRETILDALPDLSESQLIGLASAATLAYTDTLAALRAEWFRLSVIADEMDVADPWQPLAAAEVRRRADQLDRAVTLMVGAVN